MKNEVIINGSVVTMVVQDAQVLFDLVDLPVVSQFNRVWKRAIGSIYAHFFKDGTQYKITLHKLLTGAKYVKRINGNVFDFRRENMLVSDKEIRYHLRNSALKGNEYRIEGTTVVILIKSKKTDYEAYVDYEDYPLISKYTWNRNVLKGYVGTRGRDTERKEIKMHRLIMGVTDPNIIIDHINGNNMDNRKRNLRICSLSQNLHNQYKHRLGDVGLFQNRWGSWQAIMRINNINHNKTFKSFDDAVNQYRAWEQEFNPSGLSDEQKATR